MLLTPLERFGRWVPLLPVGVTVGKSIIYTIFALTNQNMQSVKTCVLVISLEIRNKPDGIVNTQLQKSYR